MDCQQIWRKGNVWIDWIMSCSNRFSKSIQRSSLPILHRNLLFIISICWNTLLSDIVMGSYPNWWTIHTCIKPWMTHNKVNIILAIDFQSQDRIRTNISKRRFVHQQKPVSFSTKRLSRNAAFILPPMSEDQIIVILLWERLFGQLYWRFVVFNSVSLKS